MSVTSQVMAQAWNQLDADGRAPLAELFNAYGELLHALGSNELARINESTSTQQFSAQVESLEEASRVVNGPTPAQLAQSRAEAPSWGVVLGAWNAREPRVGAALQALERAYARVRAVPGVVSATLDDAGLRAWAWERAGRERGTGPGAGAARPRRGRGREVFVLALLAFVALGQRRG